MRARLAVLPVCVVLVGALLGWVVGCGGSPPPVCTPTAIQRSGQVPSVQASPEIASITGVLVNGETVTAGKSTEVRWLVDSRRAGPQLQIVANLTDTNNSFERDFPTSRKSGIRTEYDTTLTFSQPGCWQLAVSTGSTSGSLALQVRQASG
ncbi:MAG: hypothetical protein J2P40_03135 [Candidatus Dormibacteraeota bacterium]|nr:hypothetical protein [Candidatus Dormibacteraeota bacterium]MBO0703968.1 hypothetical protein [Candidatus Dormibacteraeota bacterium]MBO0760249.1 hypothetical protein [Candidatus Dormibacteraeota bacterium]